MFVNQVLSPLIAVSCSPDVDEIVKANNIPNFVHLLQPLASPLKSLVSVHDINGQEYSFQDFYLRFRQLDKLESTNPAAVTGKTHDFLNNFQYPKNVIVNLQKIRDVQDLFSDELSPIYHIYKMIVSLNVGMSEHETFNHPFACSFSFANSGMMVISTANPDPLNAFNLLYTSTWSSKSMSKPYLDPTLMRHYVILHDRRTQPAYNVQEVMRQIQSSTGCQVSYLEINGVQSSEEEYRNHICWFEYFRMRERFDFLNEIPHDLQRVKFAQFIADSDLKNISKFLGEFVQGSLVPFMEKNIRMWNDQVASARRGLTNRLLNVGKKYFGSSSKSTAQTSTSIDESGQLVYNNTSPEMILRRLADCAFILRDYKFAMSVYETVKKDFQQSEKAAKYLAGVYEMIALSSLLSDAAKPIENQIDSALSGYKATGSQVYETRLVCIFHEIFKARKALIESNVLLSRLKNDDSDIRTAILHEESAVTFLMRQSKMCRKSCLEFIFAGQRYLKCNQHGLRCYLTAMKLYENQGWSLIEDHVNFVVGSQSFQLSQLQEAAEYFIKLFKSSRQSASLQNIYLREFLNVYSELKKLSGGGPVNLPAIEVPEAKAVFLSLYRDSSEIPLDDKDEQWEEMEKAMYELYGRKVRKTVAATIHGRQLTCSVEELHNPLQIEITLNAFKLDVKFEDKPVVDECVVQTINQIVLGPAASKKLSIAITPKEAGKLDFAGFSYLFCGEVPSYRKFRDHNGTDYHLKVNITAPMPIVDVMIHAVPDVLFSGEVVRCVLQITNRGLRHMQKLGVKISHPSFMYIGTPDQVENPPYTFKDDLTDGSIESENVLTDPSMKFLNIGEDYLEPNGTALLPLWIRGDRIGKHKLRIMFAYQSKDDDLSWRTSKHKINLVVQPSLRINAFTRPSVRNLNEFILGVEVENLQNVFQIAIRQVTSVGSKWIVSYLGHSDNFGEPLGGRQIYYMYFKFKRVERTFEYKTAPETAVTDALEGVMYGQPIKRAKATISPITLVTASLSTKPSFISCTETPLLDLTFISRMQWRLDTLKSQYATLKQNNIKSIFTTYFTDDVDLCIFWEIPGANRRGHHYIMGINLGLQSTVQLQSRLGKKNLEQLANNTTSKALFAQTVREQKALIDALVKNRFKDSSPIRVLLSACHEYSFLVIPVTIKLLNTSHINAASFKIQLLEDHEDAIEGRKNVSTNLMPFNWLGSHVWENVLGPDEEKEATFYAVFPSKGVYDINKWKMETVLEFPSGVKPQPNDNAGEYVQTPTLPHLVIIKDENDV